MATISLAILISLNLLSITYNLQISINFPFLMSKQAVISYMMNDNVPGNYFIQYSNGTLIKYNPTLKSSQIIAYPSKIDYIEWIGYVYNCPSPNGTTWKGSGNYNLVIENNWASISFRNITTYALLARYDLNDTIIKNSGKQTSNPYHVVVCKNSIQFIYQSQIYMVYNYSTTFGSNFTAVSAVFQEASLAYQINIIIATYRFYVSNSINQTYQFNLNASFLFNEQTSDFDFTSFTFLSYKMIFTSSQTIVNMLFYNSINKMVVMQSLPSQRYYFYLVLTGQLGTGASNLTSFLMYQLVNYGGNLYILSKTGLIQINVPTNNSINLVLLSVVSLLPHNNYELVFGPNLGPNLMYIINEPNIYKAGLCIGQTSYIKLACTNYSCNAVNCSYCPFNSQTCGLCDSGFSRNSSFLCAVQQNPTDSQSLRSIFIQYLIDVRFLVQLLKAFLASLSAIIAVPGARAVITPIFYLFGNFDSLFLYQYHDSAYNYVLKDFFSQLNNLQTDKWNWINANDVISKVGNLESFNNLTNFQQSYQRFNYTYNTLNDGQSEGLFYNSQSYFFGVLPIVCAYFCVFHLLFRYIFRYSISKIIRKYQFWLFLFLIQLDGNVQQLIFYLSREWISIFSFSYQQKLLKTAVIYYGFVLVFVSCSAYYFCRWFYKQKIKVVIENCRNNATGIFYATFQFGLRNMYFGAVNFYGRFLSYYTLVSILLVSETLIFLSILFFRAKLFKKMLEVWLFLILSFLRILFIVSLIFDFPTIPSFTIFAVQIDIQTEQCQFVLIVLMIVVFIIGIIIGLANFIKFYVQFLYKNCFTHQHNKVIPFSQPMAQKSKQDQSVKSALRINKKQIIQSQRKIKVKNDKEDTINHKNARTNRRAIIAKIKYRIKTIKTSIFHKGTSKIK